MVAATYVGTVVGAGFASGQEILRFFTHHGGSGILGIALATVLFALLGATIVRLGHETQAESHLPVVEAAAGRELGRVLDWVMVFFLFGGSAVMMAGSGAVFVEHWGLPRVSGTIAMAVLAGGTVLLGLRGVVTAISAVAPLLLLSVLALGLGAVFREGIAASDLAWSRPAEAASPHWVISSVLYVSYNLILAVAVLGPLGREVAGEGARTWGAMLGGIGLGLGALAVNLGLLAALPGSAQYEVPMLYLGRALPPWVAGAYSIILWAEVYTTAVSSLYGLAVRLAPPETTRFRTVVLAVTLGALLGSQFGFARMVGILYPAVGWAGLLFVGGLTLRRVRSGIL